MAEVLLSTDDLTVIGGPSTVELSVDFGAQGQRGTQIRTGFGNPNEVEIGFVPNLLDFYINTQFGSSAYAYMYQYKTADGGGYNWEEVIKLTPTIYATNETTTFALGESTIIIPIVDISSDTLFGDLDSSRFNVQYQVTGPNPISSSMYIGEISTESGYLALPITINAVEFSGGSWVELSGSKTVHLLITVV